MAKLVEAGKRRVNFRLFSRFRIRCAAVLALVVAPAVALTALAPYRMAAQDVFQQHPSIEAKNFKTETCVTCHTDKKKGKVVHPALEAGCEVCHVGQETESGFKISLVAGGNDLCFTCHNDKKPDLAKAPSTHWPVVKSKCITCHDPHSSANENLLREPVQGTTAKENLCLTCHKDIAALLASKNQHMAVLMGCGACHVTHKAGALDQQDTRFHLKKPAPQLCLDCHDVSGKEIKEAHHGQPFEKVNCADCHNPHGSDRPKLINTYVHMPFEQKMCEACHSAPQNGKVVVNEGGKRALCYMCHPDIKAKIEKAKVPHGLFAIRDYCTDCHSPHASANPHQLRESPVALCETCHTDRREELATKKFIHPPVVKLGCTVCHDPHASDYPGRLRASVNALCLSCHAPGPLPPAKDGKITLLGTEIPASFFQNVRRIGLSKTRTTGHPLTGHPVSGPNVLQPGKRPITCVTCHNPHASDFTRALFNLKPGVKSVCLTCHA